MELSGTLSRVITGRLFTEEEVKRITSGAVGKYFADLFPLPKREHDARVKAMRAQEHIAAATAIVLEMQTSLESQIQNLNHVLRDIEEKKNLAERYEILARTGQQEIAAFRAEMEESLRKELQEQATNGKTLRRSVSILIWLITLVIGAALGAYFKDILGWFL